VRRFEVEGELVQIAIQVLGATKVAEPAKNSDNKPAAQRTRKHGSAAALQVAGDSSNPAYIKNKPKSELSILRSHAAAAACSHL
jgi:hypothetical protein